LINNKANLNQQDTAGMTPMVKAACINNYEAVLLLLNSGADPEIATNMNKMNLTSVVISSYRTMLRTGDQFPYLLKVIEELEKRGIKVDLSRRR
jgi:ankyrin repeat protein